MFEHFWLMKQSSQLYQSPDDDPLMSCLWLGLNSSLPDQTPLMIVTPGNVYCLDETLASSSS